MKHNIKKKGEGRGRERTKYQLLLMHAEKPPLELKEIPSSPQEVQSLFLLTP